MRKKWHVYIIFVIVSIVLYWLGFANNEKEIMSDLFIMLSSSILGIVLTCMFEFARDFDFKLLFQVICNYNVNIRVSFSYLFRIQVDGTYFLIRGNKVKKFQPVGGVFQKYDGSKDRLRDIFQEDDELKKGNKNDLRGKVCGKDLKKFISWFNSRRDREITCDREFKEELINTGILDAKVFDNIIYTYVGTHTTGVITTDVYGKEFLLAEIYDLELNDLQEQEFLRLKEKYDNCLDNSKFEYAFVTEDEIRKRCTSKRKTDNYEIDINNHTFKILKGEQNNE